MISRGVHDHRREILAHPPQLHQPLDLSHFASVVVLPVFGNLIRDIHYIFKTSLILV